MSVSSDRLLTLLDLVDICDNVHIRRPSPTPHEFDAELLIPLCLSATPSSPVIGLLRPILIDQLIKENQTSAQLNKPPLWDIRIDTKDLSKPFVHRTDGGTGALTPSVSLQPWLDTHAKRTAAIKELCERWRDTGIFPEVCGPKKWRSELYPVYKDPFGLHDHPSRIPSDEEVEKSNFAFEMERAACALFGVVTYGVHLTIYDVVREEGKAETLRLWVPTRAKTKQTWPGYLDNTVAGGIPSGIGVFESLVKESMEEASLEEDLVRQHARAVGSISYFFRTDQGWLQPEIEYLFDIRIPDGVDHAPFVPKPLDGEVECFEFLDQEEVMKRLKAGLFKANCGMAIIDLLIRLGYVTPDNETDFMKIQTRLHGRFDYERW
ncbi:nudix hydrolase 20 [Pleurotus eryngii]|uniref:Nudix hydrolase 20 n=1 Tax=Pleurotus eryngii TaxID=5323 RepID=A0A9P6DI97_PLEER|nr:nudix hydrolase 20 [Pleurotus eryngii]